MSQLSRLYDLLSDGEPHRTDDIVSLVYGQGMSLARVGARIYDIKKRYGVEIDGWKDKINPALFWYQMRVEIPADSYKKQTEFSYDNYFNAA